MTMRISDWAARSLLNFQRLLQRLVGLSDQLNSRTRGASGETPDFCCCSATITELLSF